MKLKNLIPSVDEAKVAACLAAAQWFPLVEKKWGSSSECELAFLVQFRDCLDDVIKKRKEIHE